MINVEKILSFFKNLLKSVAFWDFFEKKSMRDFFVVLELIEKFKYVRDEFLWVRIVFADWKIKEPDLSINWEKHIGTDFSDFTGDKFGWVENRNNHFLDNTTEELDTHFVKDYSCGAVDQNWWRLVFFGINFEEFILLEDKLIDGKKFCNFLKNDIFVVLELEDKGLVGCGKQFKHLCFGLECDGPEMFV